MCPTCNKAFRHKGNLMRHMVQHEGGNSDERKAKYVVKGEPDGDRRGYVVVEVINDDEEIEYDDGEYELDPEQMGEEMVEADETETFNLVEGESELVTAFDFDDEGDIKH
jgi:hypothetical protein